MKCDSWSKLHNYETYFQKDDSGILEFTVLQINQDLPVHKLFPQFWRYHFEKCDTHFKTGSATANAGAVGITFCCIATVSQISWIIGYNYIGEGFSFIYLEKRRMLVIVCLISSNSQIVWLKLINLDKSYLLSYIKCISTFWRIFVCKATC